MKKMIALCALLFSLMAWQDTAAQNRVPLKDALDEVTRMFGTKFVYERSVVANMTTNVNVAAQKGKPIEDVLKNILYPNNLLFLYVDNNHYTIVRRDEKAVATTTPATTQANDAAGQVNANADVPQTVSGKVTGPNNLPVAGISVTASKSGAGTTTDANGNFTIRANANDVLLFSSVGYETMEVAVGNQSTLNLTMTPRQKQLDEVVVVAYGTQERKDLTGSVSTISGRDITELPPTINVEQALQGRAAGVTVVQESGQPGAATRVRIRGSSSLLGSNQPL